MKKLIAGADEAGRGCLIGPLVIAISSIEKLKEFEIQRLGARDSKTLSPAARERLYEQLKQICRFEIIRITAQELNSLMGKYSLNEIEAMKIAEAVKGKEFSILYVDSPDSQEERFEQRILSRGVKNIKIVSSHRADSKYPIVSSASIAAKVERDAEIERIKKELGYDFNSGYTSDPITMEYVKENIHSKELRKYLRTRWETFKRLIQSKLDDY
ncbi:MAG: ribonuclease HII [Candidatus Micrarchaeota archaeon]